MSYTDISGVRHGEHALIVHPVLKSSRARDHGDARLQEICRLAEAIDLRVVRAEIIGLAHTVPATLFGSGQVEGLAGLIADQKIVLAVVDYALTPVQQRNLEKHWNCKVIDRTGLILEIFGNRARSREGMLQVELAALDYQKSRLVRSWTHLERQRGGFGFLGGPGESQLEIDRRLITRRIARVRDDLDQVRRTRGLQRENRQRAEHPTVALVGYTNAGKSTLFNRLTGAAVLAKDMLFATLDPTMRGMKLPGGQQVILSDTVGFITDLPTHLVEAFRATLEEVQQADVIIHVRDMAHADTRAQRDAVMGILADLGIGADDDRLIETQNKIDLLPAQQAKFFADLADRATQEAGPAKPLSGVRSEAKGGVVCVSATTGAGIDQLLALIEKRLNQRAQLYDIAVSLSDGTALSWLHAHGKILSQRDSKTKTRIKIRMKPEDFGRFEKSFVKKPPHAP